MNPHNKNHDENEPLHIHLGDDEDEHDKTTAGNLPMQRNMTTTV